MTQHLQETGLIAIPGAAVNVAAATTSAYFRANHSEHVECGVLIGAAGAATSAERMKIEILAAKDAAGTNAEVVSFQYIYNTVGAPAISQGTGIPTRINNVDSNGNEGKGVDWTTLLIDGNVQVQVVIPIRTRQLPVGKGFIAMRLTPNGTARTALPFFIQCDKNYGESSVASMFV